MQSNFFYILSTIVTGILCVLCLIQMIIISDVRGQLKRLDQVFANKEEVAIYRGELASNNNICEQMQRVLAERGLNNGN